jgi:hypothetical protein
MSSPSNHILTTCTVRVILFPRADANSATDFPERVHIKAGGLGRGHSRCLVKMLARSHTQSGLEHVYEIQDCRAATPFFFLVNEDGRIGVQGDYTRWVVKTKNCLGMSKVLGVATVDATAAHKQGHVVLEVNIIGADRHSIIGQLHLDWTVAPVTTSDRMHSHQLLRKSLQKMALTARIKMIVVMMFLWMMRRKNIQHRAVVVAVVVGLLLGVLLGRAVMNRLLLARALDQTFHISRSRRSTSLNLFFLVVLGWVRSGSLSCMRESATFVPHLTCTAFCSRVGVNVSAHQVNP